MPEQESAELPDVTKPGPWTGHPKETIRQKFRDFAKVSPFPEKFRGVVVGIRPPTEPGSWEIVDMGFSVEPSKREGRMAPCNFCDRTEKWFKDGVLISVNGWLHIIGPECGRTFLSDYRHQERTYTREQANIRAEAFVLSFLDRGSAWLRYARALGPFVEEARVANKSFKSRTSSRNYFDAPSTKPTAASRSKTK